MNVFSNRVFFVGAYIMFVLPTYVLPYLGSNSAILNAAGAATGLGSLPQFWFHLVALYILIALAWLRGGTINRSWIAILPFLAAIFDMTPGLNILPLIPTAFHCATLIIGVKHESVPESNIAITRRRYMFSGAGLAAFVLLAAFKTVAYTANAKNGPTWAQDRSPPPSSTVSSTDRNLARSNPSAYQELRRAHRFDLLPLLSGHELLVANFGLETAVKLTNKSTLNDIAAKACASGTTTAGVGKEATVENLQNSGAVQLNAASALLDPKVVMFNPSNEGNTDSKKVSYFAVEWVRKPITKNDLSDFSIGFLIVETSPPTWQFWRSSELCVVAEGGTA